MNPYPDLPRPRRQAIARDALTVLMLLAFVWLGVRVHHDVDRLSGLGTGVTSAGTAVQDGLSAAGSAVSGVPLAGGALQHALDAAARSTGGNVAAAGRAGTRDAHHLATVLGLLVWGLPTLLLLLLVVPRRVRELRELAVARRALAGPDAAALQRLLALRAAVELPEPVLLAHSQDPVGDLLAGRYEPLAAAALTAAGVDPGRRSPLVDTGR